MKKKLYLATALFVTGSAFGESSVLEDFYNLQIPDSEFVEIRLKENEGLKLPFDEYPKLGKRLAFKLIPASGPSVGKPIKIVIQAEPPRDKFINELAQQAPNIKRAEHKKAVDAMLGTVQRHKRNKQGLQAFYRAVNTPSGIQYKLYHLRIPGSKAGGRIDDDAVIVATPEGNLQLFETAAKTGEKSVLEVATGKDA